MTGDKSHLWLTYITSEDGSSWTTAETYAQPCFKVITKIRFESDQGWPMQWEDGSFVPDTIPRENITAKLEGSAGKEMTRLGDTVLKVSAIIQEDWSIHYYFEYIAARPRTVGRKW